MILFYVHKIAVYVRSVIGSVSLFCYNHAIESTVFEPLWLICVRGLSGIPGLMFYLRCFVGL